VLAQNTAVHADRYADLHLIIDFERETVQLDGVPLKLTKKSFCLLAFLARRCGELIPREALLNLIWGSSANPGTRTLDVHIRRLRKHLGAYASSYIETIFGVGYRFQPCGLQNSTFPR
jgi:DNA-binding response OmpR family regulator